jgi:hypothetical protein
MFAPSGRHRTDCRFAASLDCQLVQVIVGAVRAAEFDHAVDTALCQERDQVHAHLLQRSNVLLRSFLGLAFRLQWQLRGPVRLRFDRLIVHRL